MSKSLVEVYIGVHVTGENKRGGWAYAAENDKWACGSAQKGGEEHLFLCALIEAIKAYPKFIAVTEVMPMYDSFHSDNYLKDDFNGVNEGGNDKLWDSVRAEHRKGSVFFVMHGGHDSNKSARDEVSELALKGFFFNKETNGKKFPTDCDLIKK